MTKIKSTLVIFSCFIALVSQAQNVSTRHIEDHIAYLASDELQGRRAGSPGEKKAAIYIADYFQKLGLQPKGNNQYFDEITLRHVSDPHDSLSKKTETIHSQNVVGYIDNGAKNTIVIGAHYDHLGLGHDHNSRDAEAVGQIHNGADDNASGVAGLIELARLLQKNKIKENNNYLFIAFTAEELGLLGSKKFCEQTSDNMKNINYMINMDMIGRLDEKKNLQIYGVGTSNVWSSNIYAVNEDFFSLNIDSAGVGPSDHTSFYLADIPVLHFFSGQHKDYHKPTDDLDKINLYGTKYIIELIYDLILETDPVEKIPFYKTKTKQTERTKYKVTLGIMPDYTADVKGLRIDGVQSDRPAEKAGLLSGDIITKIGDLTIKDIYDYMKALGNYDIGETTTIEFVRDDEAKVVDLTF